jgi:hypothetical protein
MRTISATVVSLLLSSLLTSEALLASSSKRGTFKGLLLHARRGKVDSSSKMPRGVKKENLPSKVCVVCGRPFKWRKKWERCWDEVSTCSKSCNAQRRRAKQGEKDSDPEM